MHCARPRDYHSLGLTRIQFHPPQVTPLTITLPRSLIRDSATATLTPGDGTTAIKVKSSAESISLFSKIEKSFEVYRRNNNGPKHCPAALLIQR